MAKKRTTIAGRPPKDPFDKVGWPERYLVSPGVRSAIDELQKRMGLETRADVHRLAMFYLLTNKGLMTDDLHNDPTWEGLKDII